MLNSLESNLVVALTSLTGTEIAELSASDIASLSANDLQALPVEMLHDFTTNQIGAINLETLSALDPAVFQQFLRNQVASLTTIQIAALTFTEVGTMAKGKLARLSQAQIAAIEPVSFAGLGAGRIGSLSSTEIEGLALSQVGELNMREVAALGLLHELSENQIAAISSTALSILDPSIFGQFLRTEIASLIPSQIAALTSTQVQTLAKGKLAKLNSDQIAAIDPAAFAGLGAGRIGSLIAAQIEGLTASQLAALNVKEVAALASQAETVPGWGSNQVCLLSASTIASMSVETFDRLVGDEVGYLSSLSGISLADFQSLTTTQFSELDAAMLGNLSGTMLSQINPTLFTPTQISAFSNTLFSSLTTTFFGALPAASLAAIPMINIPNLSLPDLLPLSSTQLAGFSTIQLTGMNSDQLSVVFHEFNPLVIEAEKLEIDGVLTIDGALSLLSSVASGGDNILKFQQLLALGDSLQASDDTFNIVSDNDVVTTAAVKNLFDDVVFGNSENSFWNINGRYVTTLGNLSATSTEWQFDELIDKWFLGLDLPTLQINIDGTSLATGYAQNSSPLYDNSGSPEMIDVLGGKLDDSALLAGIAETALQDPNYIKQLITDNRDGTYQIEMPNIFGSSFVTVNNQLPLPVNGAGMASATDATGLWVALLEKAAAQNSVNSSMVFGHNPDSSLSNSYASITVNADDQVMLYSGQFNNTIAFYNNESQSEMNESLNSAENAFTSGSNVVYESGNHFWAVSGIDVGNGLVSIYNPMGGQSSMVSLSSMASNGDILFVGVTGRAST